MSNTTKTTRPLTVGTEAGQTKYYRIGDVAEMLGITQRTIRYYEERGLLAPPSRSIGDFREFSDDDLERIRKIRELRDVMGFSLAEISAVLEGERTLEHLRREYRGTSSREKRLAAVEQGLDLTLQQVALLDKKLEQLHRLRDETAARAERYRLLRSELAHDQSGVGERGVLDA